MRKNNGIDKVRGAVKVIIDFCRTHRTCEDCEAWEKGQDYGCCQFRASYPDDWGAEMIVVSHKSQNDELKEYIRPLPALRDERGEIKKKTVKQLLAKINEELDELKEEILITQRLNMEPQPLGAKYGFAIAEEAADTITAITTMLEALGIDADMRDEAQRRVNEKNRERGRL